MKPTRGRMTSAGMPSVPADPEQTETERRPATPAGLVVDASREVGFLDAPTLDADELAAAIGAALGTLVLQAVLTVYSARVSVPSFAVLCRESGLDLLAAIEHDGGGTTFTLRRDLNVGPAAPGGA